VAVQVVPAGPFPSSSGDGAPFRSYQLNLVLDDPGPRRLFVAYNADRADIERKAGELARFLAVPRLARPAGGRT
jgi:hypothetical protein